MADVGGDYWSLEELPLSINLHESGDGRPANTDHTPINKVSEEFTCRKSSIFNIAIAFLFSFIRHVTTGAHFQEVCLNAFLSYFSFFKFGCISREQMFSYYLKKTRRPDHLSGWTVWSVRVTRVVNWNVSLRASSLRVRSGGKGRMASKEGRAVGCMS